MQEATHSQPKPGKTFTVALGILGTVALVQLFALTLRVYTINFSAPAFNSTSLNTLPLPEQSHLSPSDEAPDLPTGNLPRPLPLTEGLLKGTAPSIIPALLEQAKDLRFRGDMYNALIKLREARLIEPRNPMVLAEIAATYEASEAPEEAAAFWKELLGIGEAAGVLHDLAKFKLRMAGSAYQAPLLDRPAGEAFASHAQSDLGLYPTSLLGFMEISKEQNAAPEGEVFLTIHLKVGAQPAASLDATDVVILVYFYETIDESYIVQTNAEVAYHWVSLPADWQNDERSEVLEVDYRQEKLGNDAPGNAEENVPVRKFYGYIARIYYKNELQDVAAEPPSLLNQFPPPNTLPNG